MPPNSNCESAESDHWRDINYKDLSRFDKESHGAQRKNAEENKKQKQKPPHPRCSCETCDYLFLLLYLCVAF